MNSLDGSEALLACFVAMDNPDSIVLRFLRARKWFPHAGVAMLVSCIGWRLSSDVEKIFEKGEEGESSFQISMSYC